MYAKRPFLQTKGMKKKVPYAKTLVLHTGL